MNQSTKSLVMKAWKGRWSPAKFSVQYQHELKRYVKDDQSRSLDILAELLLNEALVGSAANDLFLSYIQHLLTSEVLPLDRFLIVASHFHDIQKPRILLDLINFVKKNSRLFFLDIAVESLTEHCELMAGHLTWIFVLMYKVMCKMSESEKVDQSGLYSTILMSCCDVIETITFNKRRLMVMKLARKVTHTESYQTLQLNGAQVTLLLPYLADRRPDLVQRISKCISSCERLEIDESLEDCSDYGKLYFLTSPCSTIASLVTIEALGNPCRSTAQLIRYLKLYKSMQRLDGHVIVAEILKMSIYGLWESLDLDQIQWIAFTYIKLPTLLSQLASSSNQLITADDVSAGLDMLLTHRNLLDQTEQILNEPNMLNTLIKELVNVNLVSASNEASLLSKLNSQRQVVVEQTVESPISLVYSCYQCIDDIISSLSQVNSGPDIIPWGTSIVASLSQSIHSEDRLNRILISAACGGKLSKFISHLLRLNELSIESSQNETAVIICDLTLLILTQIVLLFSKEVFIVLASPAHSNSVFMRHYLSPLTQSVPTHPNIGSNDCLDELLSRIVNKQSIIGFARFRDMIMCLPLTFVELAKARQLSASDESTIIDVISQVSSTSHSLLLYSVASLVNEARLSPSHLREKHLHIVNSIASITTSDSNRDTMLRSIVNRLLSTSGLTRASKRDSEEKTANEPMMIAIAKSIENILDTGFISTTPYKILVESLKFTEPKWLVQKMFGLMFKCSYIEEIAKTLTLLHTICHLLLPSLAKTFIKDSIPDLFHKTAKPAYLAEPRSQFACQLIVWAIAALNEQEGKAHSAEIQQMLGQVFVLLESIYKTYGTNQLIYVVELLVQNILELGAPYNYELLANIPVSLMIKILPKDHRLFPLLCEREDLTVEEVNKLSSSLLYKQVKKIDTESET